ncbi:MAG: hypothetical protein DYG89_53655 [Caldilinea sp. CFX5]|nr:hypothetical protein [Caldilinea sp. CFX5]
MTRLLQQYLAHVATAHNAFVETLYTVQNNFWDAIFQIKSYANPTLYRRLDVAIYGNEQFAYQKAESRFDNYPIRAIIRDDRF